MPRKKKPAKKAPPRPGCSKAKARPEVEVVEAEVIEAELVEEPETGLAVVEPHVGGSVATVDQIPSVQRTLATWLADKHAKTVRKYQADLGDFAAWWHGRVDGDWSPELGLGKEVPLPVVASALEQFTRLPQTGAFGVGLEYRSWLANERKLAPNTTNRKLAALRSYIKLAKQVGASAWALEIPSVKTELVRDVAGPGAVGYAELVAAAEAKVTEAANERSRDTWLRNVALLRMYHDAGLRRMEPLTADYPKDLDLRRGEERIRIRRKKRTQKAWFDLGSQRCVRAIKAWLKVRGDEEGPLFFSLHHGHRGKRLNLRSVNKMITEQLGGSLDMHVTPHGLRHTAATTLLDKTDGNVRAVAEFLGHSNLATVQQYDDARKKQAKRMGSLLDDED